MAFLRVLLFCLCLLAHYSLSRAQNVNVEGCPSLPTFSELTSILNSVSENQPGDGSPANTIIESFYISCLSVGNIRGYYRQATYVVRFTGEPGNTGSVLAKVDIVCDQPVGSGRIWKLGLLKSYNKVTDASDALLLTSNVTLTDCSRCNSRNHDVFPLDPNKGDDVVRHCRRCPGECLVANLTLCYGDSSSQCCNVYIGNRCAVECPLNFSASPATNFVCECAFGCQNNGTANDECNMCNCPVGTTGQVCETVLDQCDPNPCQNGGTCIPGTYPDYTCRCPPGFTGENCSIALNPCDPNPCQNGGSCIPGTYPEYTCRCPPGFTGENCSIALNPCENNPCLNGGTCVPGTYPNFTCNCPPKYTGSTCETDLCNNTNCQNGGTCVVVNGTAICKCRDNFSGDRCENCDLPNCKRCSTETKGLCLECIDGFIVDRITEKCTLDCSACSQLTDRNLINICNYFCELLVWRNESIKCDLTIPTIMKPDPALPVLDQYIVALTAANISEGAWNNGATNIGLNVGLPDRNSNSFSAWKDAVLVWVENLKIWLEHIKTVDSGFPNFNLTNILDDIDTKSQEVYNNVRAQWLRISDEFRNRIANNQCS